jgi:hypothetical protein
MATGDDDDDNDDVDGDGATGDDSSECGQVCTMKYIVILGAGRWRLVATTTTTTTLMATA